MYGERRALANRCAIVWRFVVEPVKEFLEAGKQFSRTHKQHFSYQTNSSLLLLRPHLTTKLTTNVAASAAEVS